MNNKILVTVYVPFLNDKYDVFIPINKKIGTIKSIIISTISDIYGYSFLYTKFRLYEKSNCTLLDNNAYVNVSNISNGSELILI